MSRLSSIMVLVYTGRLTHHKNSVRFSYKIIIIQTSTYYPYSSLLLLEKKNVNLVFVSNYKNITVMAINEWPMDKYNDF